MSIRRPRRPVQLAGTKEPAPPPPDPADPLCRPADPRERAALLNYFRTHGLPDPIWAGRDLTPLERLQRRVDELEDYVLDLKQELHALKHPNQQRRA